MNQLIILVLIFVVTITAINPAASQPPPVTGKSHERQLKSVVSRTDPVQLEAFRLFEQKKVDEAKELLERTLAAEENEKRSIELLYFVALLEQYQDNYMKAIKHLKQIEKIYDAQKSPNLLNQAKLEQRMGDCYFGERKIVQANDCYKSSLATVGYLNNQLRRRVELLDSLSGCARFLKKKDDLKYYLEQQNKILSDTLIFDPLTQTAYYLWNNLELINVYRDAGQEDKVDSTQEKIYSLMTNLIDLRMKLEKSGRLEGISERMTLSYLRSEKPDSIADCLWLVNGFKVKALPLIIWKDPGKPIKAAILCIHGMGLENRAFTPLGEILSEQGFVVAALDVRGFGSWLEAPGNENIDFKDTIGDIDHVIKYLKRQYNVPVFLLGESMGGAIALRAAAELGDVAQGVISSVPSAEQFQRRRMAFDVAIHFLKSPNKPYEVLEGIAKKATKNPELRAFWTEDARAKSHASPKELIKFAVFMRQTERACNKIKHTPVFIVQGLGDELVKPEGTVKMFKNVKTKDKNIFIIGKAEHLIFETDQQNMLLLNTITDWIDDRLKPRPVEISK